MEVRGLQWTLKAKDQASSAIETVNKKLDNVKKTVPTVTDAFSSGMGKISQATGKASKSLQGMAKKTRGVSAVAGAMAGAGVKAAIDYEKKLNFAGVQANMTKEEIEDLGKTIKNMEKRSTSVELLDAAGVYASAGLIKDEIVGVMKATEQISRITGDSNVASDMLLTSQVAFNVDLSDEKEVQRMGDRFAKGSALAKLEMDEINETVKVAQGTFKNMNMTADDSIATTVLLAKAGYLGSQAGTMLNATYNDLISKAEDGAVAFGDFNLSLYDAATGQMKTLPELLEEIEKGTASMSEEQRNAALASVFGANSQKMVNAYLGQGSEAYKEYAKAVSSAEGDLQKKYDETGQTAAERWAKTKSSLMDAAINLGEAMLPAVETVASVIGKVADYFSGLDEGTQKAIGMAVLGLAAMSPMLSFASKLTGGISDVTGAISKLTKEGSLLRKGVGLFAKGGGAALKGVGGYMKDLGGEAFSFVKFLGKSLLGAGKGFIKFGLSAAKGVLGAGKAIAGFVAANPMILVAAGVVAAGVLIYKNWDKIKEKAGQLKDSVSEKWNALKESTSQKFEEIKQSVSEKWQTVISVLSVPVKAYVNVRKAAFEKGIKTVKSLWGFIKDFLSVDAEGKVLMIKDAFERAEKIVREKWTSLKSFLSNPIQGTVSIIEKVKGKASDIIKGNYAVGATNIGTDHIAQVHKGETILPANLAKQYRALGGTRHKLPSVGGGQQISFNPSININIEGNTDIDTVRQIEEAVNNQMNLFFRKMNLQRA